MDHHTEDVDPVAPALLVRDMRWYSSWNDLVQTIHKLFQEVANSDNDVDVDDHEHCQSTKLPRLAPLPLDVCQRIADFFVIEPVRMDQVEVLTCSSHDANCDPNNVLSDDENSWWISEPGSMPGGVGSQEIEFLLNNASNSLRRIQEVCIKIPPMPQGPLSLRTFQIFTTMGSNSAGIKFRRGASLGKAGGHLGSNDDTDWSLICHSHVANHAGWQRFIVIPTDCLRLRLVCLANQISVFEGASDNEPDPYHRYAAVGLFSIRFE